MLYTLFSPISYATIYGDYKALIIDSDFCIVESILSKEFVYSLLSYVSLLFFISVFPSFLLYKIIRYSNADKYFNFLRFANHWHYYLTGEFSQFKEFKKDFKGNGRVLFVYADVLTQNGDDTCMYTGVIKQHTFNPSTRGIDSIYLSNVKRYKKLKDSNFKEVKEGETEPNKGSKGFVIKDVPTDCFIIPYRSIININLRLFFEKKVNNRWIYKDSTKRVIENLSLMLIPLVWTELAFDFGGYIKSSLGEYSTYVRFFLSIATPIVGNIPSIMLDKNKKRKQIIGGLLTLLLMIGLLLWVIFKSIAFFQSLF
ncbi:hypothetical protein [Sediminitomix flava]|nr:hypothetical protein [Sediminitomix flava]